VAQEPSVEDSPLARVFSEVALQQVRAFSVELLHLDSVQLASADSVRRSELALLG